MAGKRCKLQLTWAGGCQVTLVLISTGMISYGANCNASEHSKIG